MASKGNANRESLGDRMKRYEAVTTGTTLLEKIPVYARCDMRAGHTFCKGLDKPFDIDYVAAMHSAASYLVMMTGAVLGYCQSDEISLVWEDSTKVPFETRLFKLQSTLASMCTAAFMKACFDVPKLKEKLYCRRMLPTFDCRVCNLPNMSEAANMILWRVRDSIKNSITLLALSEFSTKLLDKKNGAMKIEMLKEHGIDYYSLDEAYRLGAFFRKEDYMRTLKSEELEHIPDKAKDPVLKDKDGNPAVIRSHVVQFKLNCNGNQLPCLKDVLFPEST